MLRMSFILSVAVFLMLLIGGRDYGQLRPGLALAQQQAVAEQEQAAALALAEAAVQPVDDLVTATFTPESAAPPAEPVAETVVAMPNIAVEPSEVEAAPVLPAKELWVVTASSVNVREGPGTTYAVLDKLSRGEAATLVWQDDTGWARIRIEGDGVEGYVSIDFLAPVVP